MIISISYYNGIHFSVCSDDPTVMIFLYFHLFSYLFIRVFVFIFFAGSSQMEADRLRRYVAPFRDVLPSLFAILSGAISVPLGSSDVSTVLSECLGSVRECCVFLFSSAYLNLLIYFHVQWIWRHFFTTWRRSSKYPKNLKLFV